MSSAADTARQIEASSELPAGARLRPAAAKPSLKPPSFEFPLEASVADAFRMVARSCLGHLLANEGAALLGQDPEGVHQVRVAVRRLRSALRFFRRALDKATRKRLRDELRWLAGALGPARDWDVLVTETIRRPSLVAAARNTGVARRAARPRAAAHEAAREALRSPRYAALVLALERLVELEEGWPATGKRAGFAAQPMADAARGVIAAADAAARKAGRRLAALAPAERHEFRKRLKELRYAASFLRPLYPGKPAQRYAAALADLQDVLGEINDYETARQLLQSAGAKLAPMIAALEEAADEASVRLPATWRSFRRASRFWEI